MPALSTYLVTAAAMITASAAVVLAREVRSVVETAAEADRRSQENRDIMTGEAEEFRGVLPRLRDLERRAFRKAHPPREEDDRDA